MHIKQSWRITDHRIYPSYHTLLNTVQGRDLNVAYVIFTVLVSETELSLHIHILMLYTRMYVFSQAVLRLVIA